MDKKCILIVDDENEIIEILERYLKERDFNVITALNGSDGIEKARSNHVDLILLDIILPDIDGPQVAKSLSNIETTKNIPILFLSGIVASPEDKKMFSEVDVDGMKYRALGKPFGLSELIESIHSILA